VNENGGLADEVIVESLDDQVVDGDARCGRCETRERRNEQRRSFCFRCDHPVPQHEISRAHPSGIGDPEIVLRAHTDRRAAHGHGDELRRHAAFELAYLSPARLPRGGVEAPNAIARSNGFNGP